MSNDQPIDAQTHKSTQSLREKEIELYNGELSGSMKGLRLGKALAQHRLDKEEAEKQEKDKQTHVMLRIIQAANQAYDKIMGNIDDFLNRVNASIEKLEREMRENRRQYDQLTYRMDAIDDVMEAFKNSGKMNRDAAQNILKAAGKNTQNTSDAELAHLLILTLSEHSVRVDDLGLEWESQIQNKAELKQIQGEAAEIRDRAIEIKRTVAPEDQPAAFDDLARKANNLSAMYEAGTQTNDAEVTKDIHGSVKNTYAAENDSGAVDYSKFTMNF